MITNPTPQRTLRGHRPPRPTPRAATTAAHHAQLAARLTPRDRWLARMLLEHRVLTTGQIAQLAWPSVRAANLRLLSLYRWRVLDRFQPFVTCGTAPMHYVLDVAGAAILAAEHDIDPKDLGYRHDRAIAAAYSLRLAHTIGVNGFFTALIAHARRPDTTGTLTAWWSETRCARHFGDHVRPDGYGRWTDNDTAVEWFLEYDFGTEDLARLAAKLTGYERLAAATGIITPVLVWLPSERRETGARKAFTTALHRLDRPDLVPVATTSPDATTDPTQRLNPAAARWTPVPCRQDDERIALSDLPVGRATTQCPPLTDTDSSRTPHDILAPPPMHEGRGCKTIF